MKFIPERLKQARQMRGMSQSQLAKAAGVEKHDIVNAERGRVKDPKHVFMLGVSAALQLDPSYFFDFTDVEIHQDPNPAA